MMRDGVRQVTFQVALILLVGVSTAVAQEGPPPWHSLEEGLAHAYEQERPVLVYVRAPWCGPCYHLEADVFPELDGLMHRVILVKVDLSDRPLPGEVTGRRVFEWIRHQGLETSPAFAVLAPDGTPLAVHRGFLPAEALRETLVAAIESGPR